MDERITLWDATKAVVRQLLQADVRTLKTVPFSTYSGTGWSSSQSAGGGLLTLCGTLPGATFDYRAAAGDPLENGVVAACVDAIAQAVADAPPVLEQRDGAVWRTVPEHPLLDLLNRPNGFYGSAHLWALP
jgi:hypothetical protein